MRATVVLILVSLAVIGCGSNDTPRPDASAGTDAGGDSGASDLVTPAEAGTTDAAGSVDASDVGDLPDAAVADAAPASDASDALDPPDAGHPGASDARASDALDPPDAGHPGDASDARASDALDPPDAARPGDASEPVDVPGDAAVSRDAPPDTPTVRPALLEATSAGLAFASTGVGQTSAEKSVTIVNHGEQPSSTLSLALDGPNAGDFVVRPPTGTDCVAGRTVLAAGTSCTVRVGFRPAAAGPRSAVLSFSATDGGGGAVPLTGTGLAAASVTTVTTELAFPATDVGDEAPEQTLTLTNTGGQASSAITLAFAGANPGDFVLQPAAATDCISGITALAAGASCTVRVAFRPATAGIRSAALTFSAATGGNGAVPLTGAGRAEPAALVPSASELIFPSVAVGLPSDEQNVTITNVGGQASTAITFGIVGADAADFAIQAATGTDCVSGSTILAGGASCTVRIVFTATAAGARSAALTFTATTGGNGTVALGGAGLAPARFVTATGALVFPSTVVALTSAEQSFTITNVGGRASDLTNIAVLGDHAADFVRQMPSGTDCALTVTLLGPGDSCTVRVAFSPTAAGLRSATLEFPETPDTTSRVLLGGTGLAPAALRASHDGLAFGAGVLGQPGAAQALTITNDGEQTSSAIALALGGADSGDFALLTPTAGDCVSGTTTLAHGASCTVRLAFQPLASGARSASLTFQATIGGGRSVQLTGTGLAPATLDATNTDLMFMSAVIGETSAEQSITLTNRGDQPSSPITIALGGANPGEFALQPPAAGDCVSGTTLAGGASCAVRFVFRPQAAGLRSASLTLAAATGGTVTLPLEGTGVTPAHLEATSAALGFPAAPVGQVSGAQVFTITNTGEQTSSAITLSIGGANPGDFTVMLPPSTCSSGWTTLAGGASCEVWVQFIPGAAGPRAATLTFSAATGGGGTVALTGRGMTGPRLQISATGLAFETVVLGETSAEQTFTITNTGEQASSEIIVQLLDPWNYALRATGPGDCTAGGTALAGGASCTARIVFRPTAAGAFPAEVYVWAASGGSGFVALSGAGITPARLTASSTELAFSDAIAVGPMFDRLYFTITNSGAQTSSELQFEIDGANAGDFFLQAPYGSDCVPGVTRLAEGASCTVWVVFRPAALGARTASLGFRATTGGSGSLALSGGGIVGWHWMGAMTTGRDAHTATLLPNGKVLVVGGVGPGDAVLSIAELYDPATGAWTPTGSLTDARLWHTATLLPNGKVLVAGGMGAISSRSAELYDPATGTWTPAGPMIGARESHTATLLPNGKVLVAGGLNGGSSAELYDPATGTWSATGSMASVWRAHHTATLLPNGKVLAAGGGHATAELYDPTTGTWSNTGSLSEQRELHTATLLPSGKVLVAGGLNTDTNSAARAELYEPASGTWTPTGPMGAARWYHTATLLATGQVLVMAGRTTQNYPADFVSNPELYDPATDTWTPTRGGWACIDHTATLLPSGKVLMAGGFFRDYSSRTDYHREHAGLYDPITGTWTEAGLMAAARKRHTATRLADRKVLVAGGEDDSSATLATVELYDPDLGAWAATGAMTTARQRHTATLLGDGKVLVAGGSGNAGAFGTAELYDPSTRIWSATGALGAARRNHTATLLPNGKVLVAGGDPGAATALATAELFDPATGTWSATGALGTARRNHTATLLPNGKVLVAGGDPGGATALATVELFDPATGTWSATGALGTARRNHTAILLPNGKVLLAGGDPGGATALGTAELFDPAAGTWTPAGTMVSARTGHTATLLANGKVLVAGGEGSTGPVASTELYDPTAETWTRTGELRWARALHTATLLVNDQVLLIGGDGLPASAEVYRM